VRIAYKYLTGLKKRPELAFLNEVSSVPLQQTLRHQFKAYTAFFAGHARYPRFKSWHGRQSASYTRSAFRMRDGRLHLAKVGAPLEFVWSWPKIDVTALDPTMVTVSQDGDGRWYVSFSVETSAEPEQIPPTGRAVGIDLGISHLATLSTGESIANPRHLERKAHAVARYQRRMARKQRGSSNRRKAKAKIARAHTKIRDARADFLHKTTTRIVRDHDLIVIEALNVRGMVRNRKLARHISDCGWGEFRRQLEYKVARTGRHLVIIDRWYPSSKTCSACGHLLAELSLGTRQWSCPSCGTRHDRDVNAAKNILAAGQAVSACGADVSPQGSSLRSSATKQETSPERVGIPSHREGKKSSALLLLT